MQTMRREKSRATKQINSWKAIKISNEMNSARFDSVASPIFLRFAVNFINALESKSYENVFAKRFPIENGLNQIEFYSQLGQSVLIFLPLSMELQTHRGVFVVISKLLHFVVEIGSRASVNFRRILFASNVCWLSTAVTSLVEIRAIRSVIIDWGRVNIYIAFQSNGKKSTSSHVSIAINTWLYHVNLAAGIF